jgi:hypothetical protein
MNFFGHATVALQQSDDPAFVLGAMLPDLASMAGLRLLAPEDPELGRGIALHHETDRRFHAAPAFRTLCEWALSELERAGVQRGSARAVGHVGGELLLDGLLSRDRAAREGYQRVLEAVLGSDLPARVRFAGSAGEPALRPMLARLARAPVPDGYREVSFVCERLHAILSRRPRLALRASDAPLVESWLEGALPYLRSELDGILAAVR